MTVSLLDAQGRPISAFGSNSQWSQGATTNAAEFGTSALFSRGLTANGRSATTPSPISSTTTGSTSMGYTDLTQGSRRGARSAPMNPEAPSVTPPPSGGPGKSQTGGTVGELAKMASDKWGPKEQDDAKSAPPSPTATGSAIGKGLYAAGKAAASRIGEFASGASTARGSAPGGMFSAAGAAGDLSEDV